MVSPELKPPKTPGVDPRPISFAEEPEPKPVEVVPVEAAAAGAFVPAEHAPASMV